MRLTKRDVGWGLRGVLFLFFANVLASIVWDPGSVGRVQGEWMSVVFGSIHAQYSDVILILYVLFFAVLGMLAGRVRHITQ